MGFRLRAVTKISFFGAVSAEAMGAGSAQATNKVNDTAAEKKHKVIVFQTFGTISAFPFGALFVRFFVGLKTQLPTVDM